MATVAEQQEIDLHRRVSVVGDRPDRSLDDRCPIDEAGGGIDGGGPDLAKGLVGATLAQAELKRSSRLWKTSWELDYASDRR